MKIIYCFCILLLIACAHDPLQQEVLISEQQSKVVELGFECQAGDEIACKDLPKEIDRLNDIVSSKK